MDSVADRYAIALLGVAREEGLILPYVSQAEQIIDIMNENEGLLRILKDYGLTNEEKKNTLDVCFKGKIYEYLLNLLYVVIDNKRGALCKEILQEFSRLALKELNIKRGVMYTTIPLTANEMKQVEAKVSTILQSTVTLRNEIDPSLVGGFKIKVEDYVLDDSITTRLANLKETLILRKGDMTDGN